MVIHVKLESPMLHAKFQGHIGVVLGSGEKVLNIYGHGGHLGNVTKTIFINLCPFSRRLDIKFGFD